MRGAADIVSQAHGAGGRRASVRALPEEVPVALTCNGSTQAVMMCTPADLQDFAVGFCFTEGFAAPDQIESLEIVELPNGIEARVWIDDAQAEALGDRRRAMMGPVGCGLCGIDSLEQAVRDVPRVSADLHLPWAEAAAAPDALRRHQPLHDATHAIHAAGFLVPGQGIVLAREDVGRHNALDKLIGALKRGGIDPATGAIVLTSRVSVELVQKTALAGAPILIAVSAPTTRAVDTAEAAGLTVAALARPDRLEVFTHPTRILSEGRHVA